MSVWSVAAVYIGGVMGAGFASGQELVVFFLNYGRAGLWGIVLATLLLCFGTGLILTYCAQENVVSYAHLFQKLHPRATSFYDLLYSLFIFIGISVMLAGIGAMGSTALAGLVARLTTAILILGALYRGSAGVGKTSSWLAPLLVVILSGLAIYRLKGGGIHIPYTQTGVTFEAAALYASYNLGFSLAVLASIHQGIQTTKDRWKLAIGANLALGLCMLLLVLALSTLHPLQLATSFPLAHLVNAWGPLAGALYEFVLWSAMYSTAIAHALALVSRVTAFFRLSWGKTSILVVSASLVFSYVGFSTLIRVAYPILGLAGLWIMANLAASVINARRP